MRSSTIEAPCSSHDLVNCLSSFADTTIKGIRILPDQKFEDMDGDFDEWTGLRYQCGCYEYDFINNASGCKHEDIWPDVSLRSGRIGLCFTITRGDYKICLVDQGLPRYWFRELAVDPNMVVWMENDEVMNVTTRKAWEQAIKFRQNFLLEQDQPDYGKGLYLDVILGPFEKPKRRYFKESFKSYMMKYVTMPKRSEIVMEQSVEAVADGQASSAEGDWKASRVESDRALLRFYRDDLNNSTYDAYLELEVSGLGFMNCSHRTPMILSFSSKHGFHISEPR